CRSPSRSSQARYTERRRRGRAARTPASPTSTRSTRVVTSRRGSSPSSLLKRCAQPSDHCGNRRRIDPWRTATMNKTPDRIVPLISDTESKPTAAMRQAIANAEVGDEQRGEDPAVNELQRRVAELLGKEAALWFPGGTMCNFVAIKVHTKPADAIVADAMAHIIRAESAGMALSSGVLIEPIATE